MNCISTQKPTRPTKIIQFGGGVFLRGFFDTALQKANDAGAYCGGALIVRSRTQGRDPLAEQNFNYTHIARDATHSEILFVDSVVGSVSAAEEYEAFLALAENPETDVIISNTTEAGIVYTPCPRPTDICPETFPAKLAALLFRRFEKGLCGMLIVPCELIEGNGETLKNAVLAHAADWKLPSEFFAFVREQCSFRNTLVDRIVAGRPTEENPLPYTDTSCNTSEYFQLFVIEGEEDARFPFAPYAGIRWVPSVAPYRTLKVRILNGAHTSMIPYALLLGVESVGDCMKDSRVRAHLEGCLEEILASLDAAPEESRAYARDVITRFENPYIHHKCAAISLNSVSKFRVRVLPSILAYEEKLGKAPKHLLFAFAQLISFYKYGTPSDAEDTTAKMKNGSIAEILADIALWGSDLSRFSNEVENYANSSAR